MAAFEIHVQQLDASASPPGSKQLDFAITREWLESALAGGDQAAGDRPSGEVRELDALRPDPRHPEGALSVLAEKSGEDVIVRGRARAHLLAACARCLEDAELAIDTEIAALFTARRADLRPVADEEDLTPEEIDREFYSGEVIVLDPLVREQILLEVPMQPLCRPDCKGLEVPAHVRGPGDLHAAVSEDGVDPRLAPLRAMMQRATEGAVHAPGRNEVEKADPRSTKVSKKKR